MASTESPTAQPPEERVLSEIFNSSTADLTLRTHDAVDFRVHRYVLVMASTVFEGMCSLPQPTAAAGEKQELPVVQMGEDSHTMTRLLMLLYPDKHPTHIDVTMLPDVLRAAEKYDMHGVVAQLGNFLRRADYVQKHPLEVFALACQYNFGDDLIELAAKASLRQVSPLKTLGSLPPAARGLSAGAYHGLLVYRQKCTNILLPMLVNWPHPDVIVGKPVWHTCICRLKTNNGKYSSPLPSWYADHVERTMAAFSQVVDASTLRSPNLIATTTYQFSPLAAGTAAAAPGVAKGRGKPAASCNCAESAPYELVKFHAVVADEVERQLDRMKFQLLG
ncbi:hypothetical protein PsYK624_147800 [Phanerochaete sordida]|uniref:BTB domain-containing protein n=1 Tax=Phanerochaete sordida TaxID=48140 RepID=A0A9P3LKG5_9APHY|nr:hypothetical protein PsYK624_147800 [Phanerochaete sordida]